MKQIYLSLVFLSSMLSLKAQVPTWSENVACILYTRCTSCHNPNGIAPFSLMDYNDAYNNTLAIYNAVNNHEMPPWPPDENYQTFAHERILTPVEIATISDWITGGAPLGNINNAPTPPVYASNAQITNPDLSVVMQPYTVPTISSDLYRCFVFQNVTSADEYITGLEVLPGNMGIVHHVLVYADTSQTTIQLDNADPDPGYTSFGGIGSNTAELIGLWAPGGQPYYLPSGMGIKVKANSHIILQLHYPVGSTGQVDSTRINFLFTTSPLIRNVTILPILNHSTTLVDGPLFIPADSIRTFHEEFVTPFNLTLLSVAPHMHLIGTSIKSFAVTPWQDTIEFIDIPEWDFHWQAQYLFRQPLKIPAGSTLYAEATYNNTPSNPHNPSNPPQDVYLGEATTDEMMLVFFGFLLYLNGDENIIIDTSTVVQTYNGCSFVTSVNENDEAFNALQLYPNPANDQLKIKLPDNGFFTIEIFDSNGKLIRKEENINKELILDCSVINNGIYSIRARSPDYNFTRRVSIMH